MNHWTIIKVLNNNVVFVKDNHDKDYIAVGNGIGFRHKVSEKLGNEEIIKLFTQTEKQSKSKLLDLLNEIPFDRFELAMDLVDYAEKILDRNLNDNLAISLADHLHFLLQRYQDGVIFPSFASEEIKRFYQEEYAVGCNIVDIINKRYEIKLNNDEATTIAFHIINATEQGSQKVLPIMYGVRDIVDIVEEGFQVKLDINSLEYSRFIIHLKFFMKRVVVNSEVALETSHSLLKKFELEFSEIKQVIQRVEKYIKDKYNYTMNADDKLYLFVHIRRLINK